RSTISANFPWSNRTFLLLVKLGIRGSPWYRPRSPRQPRAFARGTNRSDSFHREWREWNAGNVAAISDLALIMLAPPEASFDHEGISPHRICERCLVGSVGFCRITGTCCVGATLYRGIQSSASEIASKCSAMICFRLDCR